MSDANHVTDWNRIMSDSSNTTPPTATPSETCDETSWEQDFALATFRVRTKRLEACLAALEAQLLDTQRELKAAIIEREALLRKIAELEARKP